MNKLGVIGNKISYSLSPDIHKLFAEQFGIEVDYQIYDLDEDPSLFIKKFFKDGGVGLNVTKPFKEIVAESFSTNSSINCLYANGTKGTSTDGQGLINDLNSKNINIDKKNILIFGLGGAAKSIIESCADQAKVYVASRTKDTLDNVLNTYPNCSPYDGSKIDLIISCATSLDESSLNFLKEVNLSADSHVYDINYSNPTNKQIRDLALVSESNIYSGIGMLVEQAAASFFLWFGKRPNTKMVKDALNERL